jgi:hypothetical protein
MIEAGSYTDLFFNRKKFLGCSLLSSYCVLRSIPVERNFIFKQFQVPFQERQFLHKIRESHRPKLMYVVRMILNYLLQLITRMIMLFQSKRQTHYAKESIRRAVSISDVASKSKSGFDSLIFPEKCLFWCNLFDNQRAFDKYSSGLQRMVLR